MRKLEGGRGYYPHIWVMAGQMAGEELGHWQKYKYASNNLIEQT